MDSNEAGMLAHIDSLTDQLENLRHAARAVVDAWSHGHLAESVHRLDSLLDDVCGDCGTPLSDDGMCDTCSDADLAADTTWDRPMAEHEAEFNYVFGHTTSI